MRSLLFVLGIFLNTQLLASSDISIITSIRPLQLIADEIMAGVGQSKVLITSDQSPHHFQLKPSQLKMASKADLLIWISNEFETGLTRLQTILSASTEQLELIPALPESSLIGEHHVIDGHIWLSPENVLLIAQLISQKISAIDPLNSQLYLTNTLKLAHKVSDWKQKSQQIMRDIKPRYILDHQFLTYFEKSFGLQNIGSLRNSHDHGSSIKQLSALHHQLEKTPAKCLLVTSFPLSRQAEQISKKYNLEAKLIDSLDAENNSHSIIDLLEPIIKSFSNCQ